MRKFKHDLINRKFQNAVEQELCLDNCMSEFTFSQSGQDLFVVAMTQGKPKGTFLELGGGQPKWSNNTFILDRFFMYTGVSIDLDYDEHWPGNQHLSIAERSWLLCRPYTSWYKIDARDFDYSILPAHFDYLQIDLDSSATSIEMLEKVCTHQQFSVITFEHDDWNNESYLFQTKQKSRDFLKYQGYELVAGNVAINENQAYEDWWAHPDFIDPKVMAAYQQKDDDFKLWQTILFFTS